MRGVILGSLIIIVSICGSVHAQDAGQLGAGIIIGRPIGLTGKYWLNKTQAFDTGLGFGDHFVIYGDFVWHLWDIIPQPKQGQLGLYASLGPEIRTTPDTTFGFRTMLGIDYWLSGHRIELFAEAGPVFHVTPDTDVHGNGGIGIRLYFNGPPTANASKNS